MTDYPLRFRTTVTKTKSPPSEFNIIKKKLFENKSCSRKYTLVNHHWFSIIDSSHGYLLHSMLYILFLLVNNILSKEIWWEFQWGNFLFRGAPARRRREKRTENNKKQFLSYFTSNGMLRDSPRFNREFASYKIF